MAETRTQSYAKHRMYRPGFHFLAFGLLVLYLGWTIWQAIADFSVEAVFELGLAVALLLLFYYIRMFAVQLQDRIIRQEMRLRLAGLLPPDLAARIPELTTSQLVALRFASDEELPELTRRCLAGELRGREEIKRSIQTWVPDHRRV